MKFFTILVVIITISLSFERVVKKSFLSKKQLSKACQVGQYNLKIKMSLENTKDFREFEGIFDVKYLITNIASFFKKGLRFDTISETNENVFQKEENYFFLPYKQFTVPFEFSNVKGIPKTLSSVYQSNDSKFYSISMSFQYSSYWETINDQDLLYILSFLNKNREQRIYESKTAKKKAYDAALSYFSNINEAKNWENDVNKITSEIESLKSKNQEYSNQIKTNEKNKLEKDKVVSAKENDVKTAQEKITDNNNKISNSSGFITSYKKSIEDLNKNIKDDKLTKEKNIENLNSYKNQIKIYIDLYKEESGIADDLENVFNKFIENVDKGIYSIDEKEIFKTRVSNIKELKTILSDTFSSILVGI